MRYRLAFLIGSPRSGTTWLQTMLGAHPAVATTVELGLFSRYVGPVLDNWKADVRRLEDRRTRYGLPVLLEEQELEGLLRDLVLHVYEKVAAKKRGAAVVLDKYPGYSLRVGEIRRIVPEASFIHIIRDGRDAAVSMLAANRSMGFGAATMTRAAEEWRKCVLGAMNAGQSGGRYHELRYEELLAHTEEKLAEVFRFLHVDAEPNQVPRIVEEHTFERLKQTARGPDPEISLDRRHLARGRAGTWAVSMSLRERYEFDRIAGDLLVKLGYAEPGWWKRNPAQALVAPLWSLLPSPASLPDRIKQGVVALGGGELRAFLVGRHRKRDGIGT